MRAMILAAGRGERMQPLTNHTPKPLLKVANKPLIVHQIEKLAAAGIDNIVINTSWLAEQLTDTLGDGQKWGVSIQYSHEPERLETAGGIRQALALLRTEDAQTGNLFLLVNSDIWCDFPLESLLNLPELNHSKTHLASQCQAHLVTVPNPTHHPAGDFYLNNLGLLQPLNQASAAPGCAVTYSGIALLHTTLFETMPIAPAPLGPILKALSIKQQLSGQLHQGAWTDIGTPERLEAINQQIRSNKNNKG